MKLAALIDPITQLNPKKDSTLAILKAGQDLGWSCEYFTLADVLCREAEVYAKSSSISLEKKQDLITIKEHDSSLKSLREFDIILMRKDPPFNLPYIYATYILELVEKQGVLVANKPQSLRDANEKMFTLNFPQCMPISLVSENIGALKAFWEEHRDVVFKPLDGMGGNSIFHVGEEGNNLSVILEMLTHRETVFIMAQKYIPEITTQGDKRILLIDGKPIPFALARIPAKGELRGNLAAGARGKVVAISPRDRWLCEQVAPCLQAKGLYLVGIDVIGDYITEINVTSPTCLREINLETGLDIAGDYLLSLAKKIKKEA